MTRPRLLLPLVLVLFARILSADLLEVRRDAPVYREPNRNSDVVIQISLSDREGPYTVPMAGEDKVNGYYKIRLPGEPVEGWIYKTFVRRFRGQHPKHQPYVRQSYQHWIDQDRDCRDTRQEVLIRDAKRGTIEFKDENECVVKSGSWVDPYSGQVLSDPKELDVDHVVPLKNAHDSGAWAWSARKRREYANYMADEKHLLAVKASENRRKAEKGPESYMPPQASFQCEYVRTWVKIKSDWQLNMTDQEAGTVRRLLAKCQ